MSEFARSPKSPTGAQFAEHLREQLFAESDDNIPVRINFNLPNAPESSPQATHLTFNASDLYNIADPEGEGPSNRLMIIGSVDYADGTAVLATVQFADNESPLTDSLVINPLPTIY